MLLWRCPPALLALRRNSLGALRHISSTKWAQQQKKALDAARRDGDGDGKVQMSAAQKAKENAKTFGYSLVIVGGVGVTGFIAYTILGELFSSESPNALFQKASQVCVENEKVQDLLGEPIKAFGEETRRGRRRHVSHLEYRDEQGRRGMRVRFYLQGIRRRATAQLDAREDSSGKLKTRFLIVTTNDLVAKTVVVEDNREVSPRPYVPSEAIRI